MIVGLKPIRSKIVLRKQKLHQLKAKNFMLKGGKRTYVRFSHI
jgi:hypothetical protein